MSCVEVVISRQKKQAHPLLRRYWWTLSAMAAARTQNIDATGHSACQKPEYKVQAADLQPALASFHRCAYAKKAYFLSPRCCHGAAHTPASVLFTAECCGFRFVCKRCCRTKKMLPFPAVARAACAAQCAEDVPRLNGQQCPVCLSPQCLKGTP